MKALVLSWFMAVGLMFGLSGNAFAVEACGHHSAKMAGAVCSCAGGEAKCDCTKDGGKCACAEGGKCACAANGGAGGCGKDGAKEGAKCACSNGKGGCAHKAAAK